MAVLTSLTVLSIWHRVEEKPNLANFRPEDKPRTSLFTEYFTSSQRPCKHHTNYKCDCE